MNEKNLKALLNCGFSLIDYNNNNNNSNINNNKSRDNSKVSQIQPHLMIYFARDPAPIPSPTVR